MSHQITCVFQKGENVRWKGQFLLARGSGPQGSLAMRACSHPAIRQSIKPNLQGKPFARGKLPGSNHPGMETEGLVLSLLSFGKTRGCRRTRTSLVLYLVANRLQGDRLTRVHSQAYVLCFGTGSRYVFSSFLHRGPRESVLCGLRPLPRRTGQPGS